jgi:hypothetical protein
LTAIKRDKAQTEKMLERINRIGKTREDLRKEQEMARAEAEKAKTAETEVAPETAEEASEDGGDDAGGSESGPTAATGTEAQAGAPKAGVEAAKGKAPETGGEAPDASKIETGAEKELKVTAEKVVEKVMVKYSLNKEKHKNTIQRYLTKKGDEFNPGKILEAEEIKIGLDKYCLNVRKINDVKAREAEVDEIIESLRAVK